MLVCLKMFKVPPSLRSFDAYIFTWDVSVLTWIDPLPRPVGIIRLQIYGYVLSYHLNIKENEKFTNYLGRELFLFILYEWLYHSNFSRGFSQTKEGAGLCYKGVNRQPITRLLEEIFFWSSIEICGACLPVVIIFGSYDRKCELRKSYRLDQ